MTALRAALPLVRSRWTRAYWLAFAMYGAGFLIGLYALSRDLHIIGAPL